MGNDAGLWFADRESSVHGKFSAKRDRKLGRSYRRNDLPLSTGGQECGRNIYWKRYYFHHRFAHAHADANAYRYAYPYACMQGAHCKSFNVEHITS